MPAAVSVRTVQLWETDRNLPVRRLPGIRGRNRRLADGSARTPLPNLKAESHARSRRHNRRRPRSRRPPDHASTAAEMDRCPATLPICSGRLKPQHALLNTHSAGVTSPLPREKLPAKFRFRNKPGRLPVNNVECPSIDLVVVGNRQSLRQTTRHDTPYLDVTSFLRVTPEAEFSKDSQDFPSGQHSQFCHYATACSSIVARIVGSAANPSSARSSPSR